MKLAVNKYNVALNGTLKVVCYYGFKTLKEAQQVAEDYRRVTGKDFVVIPWRKD